MPPPAPGAAARDRARGRGGRLHARLHQPHLRQPARHAGATVAAARRWWRSRARAGLPLWIPDDVAGHCCATPWSSKGYRARQRVHGAPDRRRAVALERRRRAAGRDRRELVRARPAPGRRSQLDDERASASSSRGARLDRLGARPAAAAARGHAAGSARSPCTRPARPATCGLAGKLEAIARRAGRRGGGARPAPPAAGWPATAACSTRSCRRRRCATRPPTSRAAGSTRTCRANRTCEIGAPAGHRPALRVVRVPARRAHAPVARGCRSPGR